MSALRFIKSVVVNDGSGVSTVTVSDIFSSDYSLYKITFNNTQSGGAASGMEIRYLDQNGGVMSDSNYDFSRQANFSNTTTSENDDENESKLEQHGPIFYTTETQGGGAVMYVSDPYDQYNYTFSWSENTYQDGTNYANYKAIGVYTVNKKISGMQLLLANGSATFKKLNINVYGIRVE